MCRALMGAALLLNCVGLVHAESEPPAPAPGKERKLPASYYAELAEVQRRYGQFDEATALYKKALDLAVTDEEKIALKMGLAETLESAGKSAQATEEWQQLSNAKNPVVGFRAKLAIALNMVAEGKKDQAVEVLETLALSCPIQNYRAVAASHLAKLVDKQQKLELYKARLAKEPKHRELLALVLELQKNDALGRAETLGVVYKADPLDLDIVQQYGVSLLNAGQLDDAEAFYKKMLADFPPFSRQACEQLAQIAARKGDSKEAEAQAEKSATGMADDVERSLYLVRLALNLKLYPMAQKYGKQAAERAKGEATLAAANMELGEALFHLSREVEAAKILQPIAEQNVWRGLKARAQDILSRIQEEPTAIPPF